VLLSSAGDKVTLSLELDKSKNPTAAPRRRRAGTAAGRERSCRVAGRRRLAGASPAAGIGGAPKPPVTARARRPCRRRRCPAARAAARAAADAGAHKRRTRRTFRMACARSSSR
jgi:hypothetical protein